MKPRKQRRSNRRTKIEYELSMNEEGGAVWLSVDAATDRRAERLFNRLHKKYCATKQVTPATVGGYQ